MGDFEFRESDVAFYLSNNKKACSALGVKKGTTFFVSSLARGEYHINYEFDHPIAGMPLVFRVNLGSQLHLINQISYEARALALLEGSGRTPRLFLVDDSKEFFGCGILVEERFFGRPLSYEHDLGEAARILADVHSVAIPPDHGLIQPEKPLEAILDECDSLFAVYRSWAGSDASLSKWLSNRLARARKELPALGGEMVRCIVNTEVNSGNFLIESNNPGHLIDWEKPVVGEPAQDIAHFLVPTTTFWKTDTLLESSVVQDFVHEYLRAVAGRFPTENLFYRVRAYLSITCLRGITWCAMAFAQHEKGARSVADAGTLAKINAYLEPGFLEFVEREYFG